MSNRASLIQHFHRVINPLHQAILNGHASLVRTAFINVATNALNSNLRFRTTYNNHDVRGWMRRNHIDCYFNEEQRRFHFYGRLTFPFLQNGEPTRFGFGARLGRAQLEQLLINFHINEHLQISPMDREEFFTITMMRTEFENAGGGGFGGLGGRRHGFGFGGRGGGRGGFAGRRGGGRGGFAGRGGRRIFYQGGVGGGCRQPREDGDAGRFEQNGRGNLDFINRGPGARFADFGSGFARVETSDEREAQASHVPVDRTIDEIVAEDTKVSENYKNIFDEDDDCVVTGLPDGSPSQMLDNWNDASFEEQLLANIERSKYIRPRKIQSLTIPLIMDGHDIKGHAETGSGKSAAFLLPIINLIMQRKKKGEYEPKRSCPYCLIIEPTRELAYQLYDQARKLAENTGVTVSKAYGKFKVKENAREISTLGCDILVGTPGRLLHFFEVKYLECEKVKMLVLDEADQLLEDDFARVLRQLPKIDGFPKIEDRQTLLFSATFAPEVQVWANDWLKKENVMVSNKKPVSANSRVVQRFEIVERAQKNTKLLELLEKEQNEAREENPANPAIKKTLVFVKMKRTADLVSTYLNCKKLKSTTINGDRSQKLREESLNDFRNGKFDIVVTTDDCARGIDIKELDHVINLDLPIDHTTYVHRIGRTGRLKEGNATSFFDPSDDMELAKELVEGLKNIGQEVPKWLEEAADGKMPMVEVPNPTMNNQQNSWGVAGFGSCFGGNDNAAAANGQQATAGNEAENVMNDGSWGGGPEIKKEPTDKNAPGNVEAPVVGNGLVQGGSRPSTSAAAAPIQSPKKVTQQNAVPPADDGNDDW